MVPTSFAIMVLVPMFSPMSTFEAVLTGGFSRCILLSSHHEYLAHCLQDFFRMITFQSSSWLPFQRCDSDLDPAGFP